MKCNHSKKSKKGRSFTKNESGGKHASRPWLICAVGAMAGAVLAWVFTASVMISGVLALLGAGIAPVLAKKIQQDRIQHQQKNEFRETLVVMLNLLESGRSFEGVIRALGEDLDEKEMPLICPEIQRIQSGLNNHRNIEDLFDEFSERWKMDDTHDFAQILYICKRTSGDLSSILRFTIQVMEEKMEAEEELYVLLSGRRLEQRILTAVPFLVVILFKIMSPDYLTILYSSWKGKLLMIGCLGIMAFSVFLTNRISKISVLS